MTAPRVLFYVQHLLGIGHLARASRVASALAGGGFDVSIVTGGMPVAGFPGPDVKHLSLPAITSADEGFSGLIDQHGNAVDRAFEAARRDLLLAMFRDLRPDILIIEAFPFGRRQMRFELLPLLEAAREARRHILIATSVRDILQERPKPGRNEETAMTLARWFDLVLLHGDPAFATLEETFPLAAQIADKVRYTGLVAAPAAAASGDRYDLVVSAGGGAAGQRLIAAAVVAAQRLDRSLRWLVIAGPNLSAADFGRAVADASPNVAVERFRTDFAALLAGCRLSVSQAGYNTVCDVLRAGCRSLLVPFAAGGETEQSLRASRLAALGLAAVVAEPDLAGSTLVDAVRTALDAPEPPQHGLDLDGAQNTVAILKSALAALT